MNDVNLIGRLTRDPDVRYGSQSQKAVARFSIAINRGKNKDGEDMGADFPNIVCFGKTAEVVERYVAKGALIGVSGRLHTDSYEKDGKKIYTTEVYADRIDLLSKSEASGSSGKAKSDEGKKASSQQEDIPSGFSSLTDDDVPF